MDVWREMRPTTRRLVEHALDAGIAATPPVHKPAALTRQRTTPYDAPAEAELSRLLRALDEHLAESNNRPAGALDPQQQADLRQVVGTCATVLETAAQSAESFAQLILRALNSYNYKAVDSLADSLLAQLPPSEMCELARHAHPAVRAVAVEVLAQVPVSLLVELLADPVDAEQARDALERQAQDYGSEEARWVIEAIEMTDIGEMDG